MESTPIDSIAAVAPQPAPIPSGVNDAKRRCAAFIDQTEKRILRCLFNLVGNWATAEDLTQDTFLKVWKAWDSFDQRRNGLAWVLAFARHEACDHLKRITAKKRGSPASLCQSASTADGDACNDWDLPDRSQEQPIDHLLKAERQLACLAALDQLNESDRALADMWSAGLTYAEIAKQSGRSENAVGSALSRIRDKLRPLLSDHAD